MVLTTLKFNQEAPPAIKNAIPGYNNLFQQVEENNNKISTLSGKHDANTKGYAINKNKSKKLLIQQIMVLVSCLKALASANKNNVLYYEMKPHSKSSLLKMRDVTMPTFTGHIIRRAEENLTQLIPYGITQQIIDDLKTLQENFRKETAIVRNIINNKIQLTREIKTLLKQNNTLLKQIDTLVNTVELRHPEFHMKYFFARKTINYGMRTLSLRGYVFNEDKNPLSHAVVNIPSIRRYARTTKLGYFEFKNLPPGILNLEIKCLLYNTTKKVVGITKGQRKDIKITLHKTNLNEETA